MSHHLFLHGELFPILETSPALLGEDRDNAYHLLEERYTEADVF